MMCWMLIEIACFGTASRVKNHHPPPLLLATRLVQVDHDVGSLGGGGFVEGQVAVFANTHECDVDRVFF